jgi:hypothetical protein
MAVVHMDIKNYYCPTLYTFFRKNLFQQFKKHFDLPLDFGRQSLIGALVLYLGILFVFFLNLFINCFANDGIRETLDFGRQSLIGALLVLYLGILFVFFLNLFINCFVSDGIREISIIEIIN